MDTGITLKIRGSEYPVSLDSSGIFSTTADDTALQAETLDKLRDQLITVTRESRRLAIRFSRESAGRVRHGTITGIHATQRAILVTWDGGARETIDSYGATRLLTDLAAEDEAVILGLRQAETAAREQVTKFLESRKLDGWQTAKDVIAERERKH